VAVAFNGREHAESASLPLDGFYVHAKHLLLKQTCIIMPRSVIIKLNCISSSRGCSRVYSAALNIDHITDGRPTLNSQTLCTQKTEGDFNPGSQVSFTHRVSVGERNPLSATPSVSAGSNLYFALMSAGIYWQAL
jgi:hypothetical protein